MRNKDIPRCPFCGSKATEKDDVEGRYYCRECEFMFDEEDIEREDIRHRISLLLDGTDEDHPKECDITIGEYEACGLSSLELPNIVKCFQVPGDGTMWFYIDGAKVVEKNTNELVDVYYNFDDFDIHDLRAILEWLEEYELQCASNRAEEEYFNR